MKKWTVTLLATEKTSPGDIKVTYRLKNSPNARRAEEDAIKSLKLDGFEYCRTLSITERG